MTKDERIALYHDIEADMIRLRAKWGNKLAAAAYVVLCDDEELLVERGCPGRTDADVNRTISRLLATAARLTATEDGESMSPMKREDDKSDA